MPDRLSAGQVLAGYRLRRTIGEGAHGAVFLAEHLLTQQRVALKLVPLPPGSHADAAEAAFLAGAATARQLQHPDIVVTHDGGVMAADDAGGRTGWLAMEAVPGSNLSRYAEPARLLPERLVLRLGMRIARALGHAHRQGVVHRDLKPANVLVHWPTDTVKLADLGLARAADAARTGTGIVPGTPVYMAPEQLAGELATPQSDFYALGVMLYQLLCGRLPHEAASMGELLRQVAAAPAPDVRLLAPQLPPGVAQAVAALLAKAPRARPADAEALAVRLQQAEQSLPAAA